MHTVHQPVSKNKQRSGTESFAFHVKIKIVKLVEGVAINKLNSCILVPDLFSLTGSMEFLEIQDDSLLTETEKWTSIKLSITAVLAAHSYRMSSLVFLYY